MRTSVKRGWDGHGWQVITLEPGRFAKFVNSWSYRLGISLGGCYSVQGSDHGNIHTQRIYLRRGKRPYILNWPREKWRCVLKFHHWPYWPGGQPVITGFCGKCCPWPCCGSIEHGHAPDCVEAAVF